MTEFASRCQCARYLRAALQSVDNTKTDYTLKVPNVRRIRRFGVHFARDPATPIQPSSRTNTRDFAVGCMACIGT